MLVKDAENNVKKIKTSVIILEYNKKLSYWLEAPSFVGFSRRGQNSHMLILHVLDCDMILMVAMIHKFV